MSITVNRAGILDIATTFLDSASRIETGSWLFNPGVNMPPAVFMPGTFSLADTVVTGGGTVRINSGGTAIRTVIVDGQVNVYAGGTANDTTISGGTLVVSSGGSLGDVTFAGSGGILEIDSTTMPTNVISRFTTSDTIDLRTSATVN
jgi:autotransporter passenger strand-loop-strand repeat protein